MPQPQSTGTVAPGALIQTLRRYLGRLAFKDKVDSNDILPAGIWSIHITTPRTISNTDSPFAIPAGRAVYVLLASAGAGAATIALLPKATGSGAIVVVKKQDANAQNVTTRPNLTDTIDNLNADYNITTRYVAIVLLDGAKGAWSLIALFPG